MSDLKNAISLLVFVSAFVFSCNDEKESDVVVPTEIVADTRNIKGQALFGIGAAVKSADLTGSIYAKALTENFTQITGEYEMKMDHMWPSAASYDFSNSDKLVSFANINNMKVHGHALLWYRSFPEWFAAANYDSAAFETKVKAFILAVVSKYKGTVISWDVANEIFNDDGTLRSDEFVFKTFKDPIGFYGRAFQYARSADENCKLFYNDYNVVLASGKRIAIKNMVERFRNEGIPIDGIGDQFHYMVSTSQATMKSGLNDMASTGLLIHISELDIRVNINQSDAYVFTTAEQQKQSDTYKAIVEMFELIPQGQKFAITTWGISDNNTWLAGWWHEKEYPLLFDGSFRKKKAYYGFYEGLK